MKKVILVLVVVVAVLFTNLGAGQFEWENLGCENLQFNALWVNPANRNEIFSGSKTSVLRSEDGGKNWRVVLSVKGSNRVVNYLTGESSGVIFAATGNGLFYSDNRGNSWRRIFQGKNYLENDCTAAGILAGNIYLGTKLGLFVSKDKGRTWSKQSAELANIRILDIALDSEEPEIIYVASNSGVFKTNNAGLTWEKIFDGKCAEDDIVLQEEPDDGGNTENTSIIRRLIINHNNLNHLYLATRVGVYQTPNKGLTWSCLAGYGLLDKNIAALAVSRDSILYAATKRGVFRLEEDRWIELSQRVVAQNISFIALDDFGNLYAAASEGLFKKRIDYLESGLTNRELIYIKNEPTIAQVQKAAISYAEVEPEKIKLWRKQAAKKALFPKVSASVNRDTSDLWHWEGGSTTKTYDDVLIRGKETIGWDVTLSWDLGEIIWNSDQTSIDARSRLAVQLRDEVLDEVTKLYFERLRVKMELNSLTLEERKKIADKQLRLNELTAMLDALSGGYFSQALDKIKA